MADNIQACFDNAMLDVLGYASYKELQDAVPVEKRLPDTASDRDQRNHAFAIAFGFENVADLIAANGMRGRPKSIEA